MLPSLLPLCFSKNKGKNSRWIFIILNFSSFSFFLPIFAYSLILKSDNQ
ncbi:hypothetical protein M083_0084 [Bacteroides fragilis str. 3986 T(B)9]|nr:hypothetical protein M083_0084 [Bacteroides fragilis str. 3986 T(B)9]